MSSNNKPRKKYRPKTVINDPIAYAIAGVKPMSADKGAMLAKQVLNADAMVSLCRGIATRRDVQVLIEMHNAVEALWRDGLGKEYSEVLLRGKFALMECLSRGIDHGGRFLINAPERQALNDLIELYNAQMDVATLRDVAKADATALRDIASGRAFVIKDMERLVEIVREQEGVAS